MTNRIHDDWTPEETKKLIRYMKKEGIETEIHCEAEGWEGVMLDRPESAITSKAIRLLRDWKEEERVETLFDGKDDVISVQIVKLKLDGKSNEDIFELLQARFPKAKLSDVKRLANSYSQRAWHDLAARLEIEKPKKLKDWRDFARLHKAYGGSINQFNKAKLIEILQDG